MSFASDSSELNCLHDDQLVHRIQELEALVAHLQNQIQIDLPLVAKLCYEDGISDGLHAASLAGCAVCNSLSFQHAVFPIPGQELPHPVSQLAIHSPILPSTAPPVPETAHMTCLDTLPIQVQNLPEPFLPAPRQTKRNKQSSM
ncbi:hypothetical protein DSO57_1011660 [Entomophthora muscae]|uniref:Uncharacterized protein n=1 Tax=Entomophthora muscae TaxID=34485 RepID=A0ACC2S896_9FUNG|nr:hypothetical protein DSO57_1011660 [Entomophthora muscae]